MQNYVAHQLLAKIFPTHLGLSRARLLMSANLVGQHSTNKFYLCCNDY
jgi:hypothetical protein